MEEEKKFSTRLFLGAICKVLEKLLAFARMPNDFTPYRALWKLTHPEDKPADEKALNLEIEFLNKLGWKHWARTQSSALLSRFPSGFQIL